MAGQGELEYADLLLSQTKILESLSNIAGSSFTSAEAKSFYSNSEFLQGVVKIC